MSASAGVAIPAFQVGSRTSSRLQRIEEVQLAAGEEAVLAVDELFDLHPSLVEEPDRLLPFLWREGEGVMQAVVLLRGPGEALLSLPEQDVVGAPVEARHVGGGPPAAVF